MTGNHLSIIGDQHWHGPAELGDAGVYLHGYCREIDALLGGSEWFLGQFSTVDCYGFVFYGWGLRAGLPMRDLPNYTAHTDRMLARPAVRRVLEREGVHLG